MQTTNRKPLFTALKRHHAPGHGIKEIRWILPGLPINLAPSVDMGIDYIDGTVPVYKFWCNDVRISDLSTDSRHQLDLRTSLGLVITELCHKHNTRYGYIEKTLIEIAPVPLHVISTDLDGAA